MYMDAYYDVENKLCYYW